MKRNPETERRVIVALALVTLTCAVLVALFDPHLVRFQPFTVLDFVKPVTGILMVALFFERALEVFLTSWRAQGAGKLARKVQAAAKRRPATNPPTTEEERLGEYKSRTQRIAFFAGTTLGVIVVALGVRMLELLVDPTVFDSLPHMQRRLFRTADVLLTGGILGGGSDALHRLVSVFTRFMDEAGGG